MRIDDKIFTKKELFFFMDVLYLVLIKDQRHKLEASISRTAVV